MHSCEGHRGAINYCAEDDDGRLWAGNDEYENTVNYCPFCGYKAKKQVVVQNAEGEWIDTLEAADDKESN